MCWSMHARHTRLAARCSPERGEEERGVGHWLIREVQSTQRYACVGGSTFSTEHLDYRAACDVCVHQGLAVLRSLEHTLPVTHTQSSDNGGSHNSRHSANTPGLPLEILEGMRAN